MTLDKFICREVQIVEVKEQPRDKVNMVTGGKGQVEVQGSTVTADRGQVQEQGSTVRDDKFRCREL